MSEQMASRPGAGSLPGRLLRPVGVFAGAAVVGCLTFLMTTGTPAHLTEFSPWGMLVAGAVAWVALSASGVARLYRGERGRRWGAAVERRWIFAGAALGVGLVASLLVGGLMVLVGLPAELANPSSYGYASRETVLAFVPAAAIVAFVFGNMLSALPLWTTIAALIIGPPPAPCRDRRVPAPTRRHHRSRLSRASSGAPPQGPPRRAP